MHGKRIMYDVEETNRDHIESLILECMLIRDVGPKSRRCINLSVEDLLRIPRYDTIGDAKGLVLSILCIDLYGLLYPYISLS
jgi:hypothetical protein